MSHSLAAMREHSECKDDLLLYTELIIHQTVDVRLVLGLLSYTGLNLIYCPQTD